MQNYRLWTIKTHGETFVRLYKLLSSFALVIRLAVGKDFIAFGGVEMGWRFGGGLQTLFSRYGIAIAFNALLDLLETKCCQNCMF